MSMAIVKTSIADIEVLKGWFPDKESSTLWCGPNIRFPFTHESFFEDIRWGRMPTYSLIGDKGIFIGFGQYYEKLQRCHLARLVISPSQRSRGFGRKFVAQLMNIGMSDLNTSESSLFVYRSNVSAINCYKSLGFKKQQNPNGYEQYENIDFMVYKNAR